MAIRDIYLKIETIPGYSPVEPDDHVSPPIRYRRDCMRNMGHEDGTIPQDEVAARRLSALIYREYLDAHYLFPKPDKLVAADVNEPAFIRRVPGTVIYARPGEWLRPPRWVQRSSPSSSSPWRRSEATASSRMQQPLLNGRRQCDAIVTGDARCRSNFERGRNDAYARDTETPARTRARQPQGASIRHRDRPLAQRGVRLAEHSRGIGRRRRDRQHEHRAARSCSTFGTKPIGCAGRFTRYA